MKLLVSKHGQQVSEYEFPASLGIELIEIGRSPSVHIMIDDPMISRVHASISKDSSAWTLNKIAKFGELTLNGKNCDRHILKERDLIELGDYSISIVSLDEEKDTSHVQNQVTGVAADSLQTSENAESDYDDDKTQIQDFVEDANDEYSSFDEDRNQDETQDDIDKDSLDSGSENLFDDEQNDEEDGADNFGFDDSSDFGDSGSDEGFDGDDKTGVFTGFATFYLKVFGENTSYDRFKIPNGETFIGRSDEKCQLVIPEDDVSTVHAVIKKSMVNCVLEDLKSANGTLLNGERVNKAELVNGDEFVIGSTTFTVVVTSDLIKEEKGRLMPVEPNQEITVEEVIEEEVDFGELGDIQDNESAEPKSKSILKDPQKRKKLLYGLVGLLLLFVLLDDGEEPAKKKSSKKKDKQEKTAENTEQKKGTAVATKTKNKKKYTKDQLEQLESIYQVGVRYFSERNYADARAEFSRVLSIDSAYKNIETYIKQTDQALAELSKAEDRRREKEKRLILEAEVKKLMIKANKAFADKNIELTNFYMNKVSEKDPENLELPYLKIEVDTYVDRKRAEEERLRIKKRARDKMVEQLKPGEGFFYQREWYKAILKLESFSRLKDIDNDLLEKAASMMRRARTNLRNEVDPLLGEARSLREGQDLKGAYELYAKIYEMDQSNIDVLNEMEEIRTRLNNRSKKIYREALIAESLSLFDEAKEKFQQVQQISPSDSSYYRKATERLKNYLE